MTALCYQPSNLAKDLAFFFAGSFSFTLTGGAGGDITTSPVRQVKRFFRLGATVTELAPHHTTCNHPEVWLL